MYQRTAGLYNWGIEPFLSRIKRRIALLCAERGCRRVLDVCCGTGTQCALLASRGIESSGIDGSPEMLVVAQKSTSASIRYLRGKADALGLGTGLFDAVIISHALHENPLPDIDDMLREAGRVLRPGGRFYLVDYIRPRRLFARGAHLFVHAIEAAAGAKNYRDFLAFMAAGGLEGVADRTGLRMVESWSFHFGATALVKAEKPSTPPPDRA